MRRSRSRSRSTSARTTRCARAPTARRSRSRCPPHSRRRHEARPPLRGAAGSSGLAAPSSCQGRAKVGPAKSDGGMRFTLRPAISDDAPAASRLLAQYGYRVDVRVVRGAFERAHHADDAQVIAVTDGDELVGLAVVALAAERGRLQALFVSKTRRRQGVGRILLAAAEAVASARGCVLMEAGAAREGGRRFLRRAGFADGGGRLVKPLPR